MKSFFSTAVPDATPIRGAVSVAAGQAGSSPEGSTVLETRLRRARLGLLVGLVGIVMIFVSFTSAYVVRQGLPTLDPRTDNLVSDWFALPLPRLLFVNTLVLLVSSGTMELARRQIARQVAVTRTVFSNFGAVSDRAWNASWLALTVVLGLSFLVGQWAAWRELAARGFYVSTNPSSSFFYLLTGTHGVHLFGGVLALLVAVVAALLRRPIESRLVILDITGWYWHFMAVLWIYILCLLKFAR
jgi:cytochrome c oxidase subunit III